MAIMKASGSTKPVTIVGSIGHTSHQQDMCGVLWHSNSACRLQNREWTREGSGQIDRDKWPLQNNAGSKMWHWSYPNITTPNDHAPHFLDTQYWVPVGIPYTTLGSLGLPYHPCFLEIGFLSNLHIFHFYSHHKCKSIHWVAHSPTN